MKHFFLLSILFFTPLFGFSESLSFAKVLQIDNQSEEKVYNAAKMFVVDNFVSSNDVLQLDDSYNHIVVVKSRFNFVNQKTGAGFSFMDGFIRFTLKIEIREGRYRVSVYDFIHQSTSLKYNDFWSLGLINKDGIADQSKCKDPRVKKTQEQLINSCSDFSNLLINKIDKYISDYFNSETEDDW